MTLKHPVIVSIVTCVVTYIVIDFINKITAKEYPILYNNRVFVLNDLNIKLIFSSLYVPTTFFKVSTKSLLPNFLFKFILWKNGKILI